MPPQTTMAATVLLLRYSVLLLPVFCVCALVSPFGYISPVYQTQIRRFGMGNSIDWSSIVFSIDWSSTSFAWCKRVGKSIDWLSIASLYRLIIDNIFCLMSKGSVKGYNTQAQFGTVAVGIGGGPTELQLWYLDRRHGNLRPSWSRLEEPTKSS